MINESGVSFYPGGGHNHDGQNSTLINTSVYSVYDFPVQIIGDPSRTADQIRNLDSFKQLIIDTVNQSIIAPAGVVFQQGVINGSAHIISRSISTEIIAADAITANEIAANTITSDLLVSNFVLVNNIISSNNYVTGVSGWAINSDGTAEFDFAVIRGTVTADAIYINNDNYWNSNGTFSVGTANNFVFFNGTTLQIAGTVTATDGQIAGWEISGDSLITGGNFSGDMILGKFLGSNFAGMKVDGAAAGGLFPRAVVTQGIMELSSVYQGNSSIALSTTYTSEGVIYENYSQQNWEFVKSGNDLFAIVDGVPYCLAQCANTTSPTTTTTSGGGGGGTTTTTTTTTVIPGCAPGECGPGCENNCNAGETCVSGVCIPNTTTTTTTTPAPPECSDNTDCPPGKICVGGTCVNQTTTTTAAPTTTTTTAAPTTTTTTAAPTTTTTTTAAPAFNGRTCTPGVLGSFGCNSPGQCVDPFNNLTPNCVK